MVPLHFALWRVILSSLVARASERALSDSFCEETTRVVRTTPQGYAPIKVQQLSDCEIGVNVNLLENQKSLTQKLNGFELGRCAPSQIR